MPPPPAWAHLPGELLERVLAHTSFKERGRAATVCHTWRQHLSQPGPLWEAAVFDGGSAAPPYIASLQRWLQRHGARLRQLQAGSAMVFDWTEPGLITGILFMLGTNARSLEALRLGFHGEAPLCNVDLGCVAGLGTSLRQVALLELDPKAVSHAALSGMVASLPHLTDLVVSLSYLDGPPSSSTPDMAALLRDAATCCPQLQLLTLHSPSSLGGNLVRMCSEVTRLTALSSLAMQYVTRSILPRDFATLTRLRRLQLVHGGDDSFAEEGTQQLSALCDLFELQITLRERPGALPPGLTKLAIDICNHQEADPAFWAGNVAAMASLRHLSIDTIVENQQQLPVLRALCSTAARLPHLRSLHLRYCQLRSLPPEVSALTQIELLDLSDNPWLLEEGAAAVAAVDLQQLKSCRLLDLNQDGYSSPRSPLGAAMMDTLLAMPALEQVALPSIFVEEGEEPETEAEVIESKEKQTLSQLRHPSLPSISIVKNRSIETWRWAFLDGGFQFDEANTLLGRQLSDCILRA